MKMKTLIVLLCALIKVEYSLGELNATTLLEGKLHGVQYSEERANELRFLACLHAGTNQCIATGFVIADYLVMTSYEALYGRNRITHVMISNEKRDVDKHLYETHHGIVENFVVSQLYEPYLVVLTLKEAAGVTPINFELKQKRLKIDFFTSTPLQVVGFTKDGPATMDVVVVQGEREKLDTGSIPLYSVNTEGDTSRRYFDYHDKGNPFLIENNLVGVLAYPRNFQNSISYYTSGWYISKITDHKAFIKKVLKFNHPPNNSATSSIEGCSG